MTVCHARCCFRHKQRTANLFHIWKFFFKRQWSSNYCRHDIKPVSDLPYFAPSRVPICSHKIRWVHFHIFFLQKHDCIVQMNSCNPSLFDIYSCSIYCSIEGSVLFPIGHQVFFTQSREIIFYILILCLRVVIWRNLRILWFIVHDSVKFIFT